METIANSEELFSRNGEQIMMTANELRKAQELNAERIKQARIASVKSMIDNTFARDIEFQAKYDTKHKLEYELVFRFEDAEILRGLMGEYGYNVHVHEISKLKCYICISW